MASCIGDPLFGPNRHTRVQRLYFRADGTPDFGIPVGNGPVPDRLSPLDRKDQFVHVDSARVLVGAGALPTTQFQLVPSAATADTFSLVPVLSADSKLVAGDDGGVMIARDDGSADFNRRSTFVKQVGLADAKGISLASRATTTRFLQHSNGAVRAGPATNPAAATFLVS